ncbi:hypothetical protein BFR85_013675 [Acinetobacter pittii]|uniref:hypothetical protein n=1 Tax=Acinetobacter pittii TaxID=48296 RepID=UPI00083D9F84|nr:hypothetical protein [Acinetobacter pittii]MCK0914092.1 hypothetical protein [Acinetobacter pittii]
MLSKKIPITITLLTCISYTNAEMISFGDNLKFDKESILVLKNPTRVTFVAYTTLEENKILKSNISVNCKNQTFYFNGGDTIVNNDLEYVSSFLKPPNLPTKENASDLIKDSLPHVIYLIYCPK